MAENMGWRTHELVIPPLAASAQVGQRLPGSEGKVDEGGSLGEASSTCTAGSGDGISAGTESWTTVTLPAGSYELVCNLSNHYADGMRPAARRDQRLSTYAAIINTGPESCSITRCIEREAPQ